MSLPPFGHTRNPALERENEFQEYAGATIPLITHSGVVEKRKTTDWKLIRSQSSPDGVEFEYLPIFSGPTMDASKSKISKASKEDTSVQKKRKDKICPSVNGNDEKNYDRSNDKENKDVKNQITPTTEKQINESDEEVAKEFPQTINHEDRRSCKCCKCIVSRNRDQSPSNKSICSRKSTRSASTVSSVTSTIRDVIVDKRKLLARQESSTTGFRYVANGLDEEDQFPRRRR